MPMRATAQPSRSSPVPSTGDWTGRCIRSHASGSTTRSTTPKRWRNRTAGLKLLQALRQEADRAWRAYVERSIAGWTRHRDIVARFGRFPHRNAVLGRDSTPEEQAHMAAGGQSFGQELQASSAAC